MKKITYYNKKNIIFAKNMRSNMTNEERILWNKIRAKRLYGYKFKRQVLIGEYIVDFLCEDYKLIIEIDGGQHNNQKEIIFDNERTNYLENMGYKVIRFWNNDVNDNIEGVCEVILSSLEREPSP